MVIILRTHGHDLPIPLYPEITKDQEERVREEARKQFGDSFELYRISVESESGETKRGLCAVQTLH